MIWLLVVTLAFGGKLADDNGFRGRRFGVDPMKEPPLENCQPGIDTMPWICQTKIGDVAVQVQYSVEHDIFYGVGLAANGFTECLVLRDVLSAAWGTPRQDNPYIEKYSWRDGETLAVWEYNQFKNSCHVVLFDARMYEEKKLRAEQKAKSATGDL